jgi:hypothetical protein
MADRAARSGAASLMPIRAESMALYPGGSIHSPEWQAIRAFIRARAGDCCEECGVRHLTYGCRFPDGSFHDLGLDKAEASAEYDLGKFIGTFSDRAGLEKLFPPLIRIVCTVAHFDHDVTHNHESNLRLWCQMHHLGHDAKHHAGNAAITRAEKAGQLDLIGRAT